MGQMPNFFQKRILMAPLTEIVIRFSADDVNDEEDDDDRLTWIPNIDYDLDDDDNTFQT